MTRMISSKLLWVLCATATACGAGAIDATSAGPSGSTATSSTSASSGAGGEASASSSVASSASSSSSTGAGGMLPKNGKYVLGHWMARMGRWSANQQPQKDYVAVMNELKDYGVDAIAVYWDVYDEAKDNYAAALDAAEASGTKIVWATEGYQGQDFKDMILAQKDRPGLFKDAQGKHVLTGYFNTWDMTKTPADGYVVDKSHGDLDYLKNAGLDFSYWPDQPWSTMYTDGERAAALGATGAFKWFQGGVFDWEDDIAKNDAGLADAKAHGVGFMPGILPFYAAQPSKNFQMFETYGFVGFRAQWKWAIDNDVPAVQMVTVNDFNEHTYLQTFGDGGPIVGVPSNPLWTGTIALDHSGFGKFMRRYVDWLETGVEPAIQSDQFLIAYRLHPRTAVSFNALSDPEKAALEVFRPANAAPGYFETDYLRIDSHDVMDDSVQVCVRLKDKATVTLSAGTTTVTEMLDAGEHIVVLKGADPAVWNGKPRQTFTSAQFGKPHLTIVRGGSTLIDKDAELAIGPYIVPGAYNYYAAEMTP